MTHLRCPFCRPTFGGGVMSNRLWQWYNTQWYDACRDIGVMGLFVLTALIFLLLEKDRKRPSTVETLERGDPPGLC